jgi:DNA-binding MarR family transcriptional regulator
LGENDQGREALLTELEDALMRAGRRLGHLSKQALTPTQFMVLRWLHDQGQMTMGDVADAVGITLAGATGLVDRLVHAGLVVRERSEEDRRMVIIRLTEAGRATLEQAHRQRVQQFRALTRSLTDDDLRAFIRILHVLTEAAQEGGQGHG